MDELDPGAKRRLLGELRQLQSLLDDADDVDQGPLADDQTAEAGFTDDEYATAQGDADDDTWDTGATARASVADDDAEPPVLDDIVDPVPADFDAAAFEDTDWNQFVDQVFAQTSGGVPMLSASGHTGANSIAAGGNAGDEDALLAELTQRLDARLATLRATMLAELEAMLARRGRLR